jgi:hypothetical protein
MLKLPEMPATVPRWTCPVAYPAMISWWELQLDNAPSLNTIGYLFSPIRKYLAVYQGIVLA